MVDSLAGLVLAAGAGTRLRPLTRTRPKPLCPVGNVALVDLALTRVAAVVDDVAVNAHHHAEAIVTHVGERAHVSVEEPEALGTAGAVGHLRPWLDRRPVLVVNGDTWSTADLAPVVSGWDGERVRVAVAGEPRPLGPHSIIVASLLPGPVAAALPDTPAGLYEVCWSRQPVEVVGTDGTTIDCGTPAAYLAANLAASGGQSVVGEGATVEGELVRSVVWDGGVVYPEERLVDAIRTGEGLTVMVR